MKLCEMRQLDDVIRWGITNEGLQPSEQVMIAIEQHFSLNATKCI